MSQGEPPNARITRIRTRYLKDLSVISIQRARYYTESWKETESSDLSTGMRVALAMKRVYEKMSFHIDPDDRIAGCWTEDFVGIPLDIERGLFNEVMEIELDTLSMLRYLLMAKLRSYACMVRRYGISSLFGRLRRIRKAGAAMPSIGMKPVHKRDVNAYTIRPADRKVLQGHLLPYWKGKTVVDIIRRELNRSGIHPPDMLKFSSALPSSTSRNETIISPGAAIANWQGHVIPDHETVLKKGLVAMRDEVAGIIGEGRGISADDRAFLNSIVAALDGMIVFAERLVQALETELEREEDPERREIVSSMLATCRKVPLYPAESFREAVQSYWTEKTALELAVPFNVHTPGRLDQLFYPYYEKDIREERITPREATELLEELLLKIMSQNMRPYSNYNGSFAARYEGSEPVTLGGADHAGRDVTNDLTYLILEAAERSKTCLNIVVRFHRTSPEDLYLRVAEIQYRGVSNVSVMNDDVSIAAMEKRGFPRDEAAGYAMVSCVDLCVPAKTGGIGFSVLTLCRILDITLRNGDAGTLLGTIRDAGLRTGDPDTFRTFPEFVDAFVAQVAFKIEQLARASAIRDRVFAAFLPSPHISALVCGPLQKKKDVTSGGGVYDLEGILFTSSIANVVDSLLVIKKLIFEQKIITFGTLLEAIDNNFSGYERLHRKILDIEGKWGNGEPEVDEIAREVTRRIFQETFRHRTYKGGFIAPFVNSMTSHTYEGRICIATPDGRKAGTPFASSCNPYNVDRHGPTGVLRSVTAIDFSDVLGAPVNIRMHPSAIGKSDQTRRKWMALIKTYFQLGGCQLQPTVVSTELLQAAQRDPESYQDVIVKVGGYSVYFVDLGREIQNEVISRTEHRMI